VGATRNAGWADNTKQQSKQFYTNIYNNDYDDDDDDNNNNNNMLTDMARQHGNAGTSSLQSATIHHTR